MPSNNSNLDQTAQHHAVQDDTTPPRAEAVYDGPAKPQFLEGHMTIIGLLISALGFVGERSGISVPTNETKDFLEWLSANWGVISQGLGILIAAYGRVRMNWRK